MQLARAKEMERLNHAMYDLLIAVCVIRFGRTTSRMSETQDQHQCTSDAQLLHRQMGPD